MSSSPAIDLGKIDPAYGQDLRKRLENARNGVRERHLKVPGHETARQYSRDIEQLLAYHMDEMAKRFDREEMRSRIALVATGGFGRCELGFHSDIDFCFITERNPTPEEEAFIKACLYPLWDLRVDLGYGVHSIRDCMAALGTDLEKTTSFLETRHLWGDQALSEELEERVHGKLHRHHTLWFVQSLKEEMVGRHTRTGNTIFLLEPDVKNARGGLRDIHQLLWIAFASYGTSDMKVLVKNQDITENEHKRLEEAWSFMIDVRNALHIMQNRRMDKLTFERQIQIAKEMNFEGTDIALPEEALMRRYYDHALVVERLSQRLQHRILEQTPGTQESIEDQEPTRQYDRDFWGKGGRIWIEARDLAKVESDPCWQIRLFLNAAREHLEVREDTTRMVEAQIHLIDDSYRKSPLARDIFLSLLRVTNGRVAYALHQMHRSGLLSAYLPEFACVTNLPRIDHYHQFAVDEHLLRSVAVCEQLVSSQPPPQMDHVAGIAKEVLRLDLLNFALLMHDVGKGEGRGHVIRGMHAIQRIAERMSLRPVEQHILRALVANHQKMSQMALRRDIDDPNLPKELAQAVGDPEMLKMLYVHTACDIRGVSEESWNDWRGRLLAILYERTLNELRGIKQERAQRPQTSHLHESISEELEKLEGHRPSTEELDHFLTDMPERYLRTASPFDAARHFILSKQLSDNRRIVYRLDNYEGSNYLELTFVARAAPGLFSNLCGALASKRINILSAQIYTAFSGEAVDIFQVEVPPALLTDIDGILVRLCERIDKIMQTGQRPDWAKMLEGGAVPITEARLSLRPPRVDINNELSPTHTVIEVSAPDRPGLLSELAAIFDRHGINIDLAFIATESYQIVDVFYVTDLETNKIMDPGQIKSLTEGILASVHSQITRKP